MHSPRRQRLIPRRAARPPKAPLVNSTSIFHYSLEMWLLEAHPSFNYALVQSYHTRVIKFLRSELLLIFCAIPRGCPGRAWKATRQPRACRVRALPERGLRHCRGARPRGGPAQEGSPQSSDVVPSPRQWWRAWSRTTLAALGIYSSGWFILLSGVGLTGRAPPLPL